MPASLRLCSGIKAMHHCLLIINIISIICSARTLCVLGESHPSPWFYCSVVEVYNMKYVMLIRSGANYITVLCDYGHPLVFKFSCHLWYFFPLELPLGTFQMLSPLTRDQACQWPPTLGPALHCTRLQLFCSFASRVLTFFLPFPVK